MTVRLLQSPSRSSRNELSGKPGPVQPFAQAILRALLSRARCVLRNDPTTQV